MAKSTISIAKFRDHMAELVTTPEAGHLLGVGPTTIKRWVSQGRLRCTTTPGGHRRFERGEIERFRQTLGGRSDGMAFRFLQHLLQGDHSYVLQSLMIDMRGRMGSWWRVADLVGECLRELGHRWEQGACSIDEEHDASRRLQQALWVCGAALPSPPTGPRCVLAAVEQDEHTLGLSLANICLREAGWTSVWLGSPTPSPVLVEAIQRLTPNMVAVSASVCSSNAAALDRHYRTIADACGRCGAKLVLGGEGAWPRRPSRGYRVRTFEEFAKLLKAQSVRSSE